MAPRAQLSVPTTAVLPHAHRLPPFHREVVRIVHKLSRQSLVSLALLWLSKKYRPFCQPFLYADQDADNIDDDAPYDPAHSHDELLEIYRELELRKGNRREIVDRILEGDWRRGLSLFQLASAEIQYLVDHPNALKWSAKRLSKISHVSSLYPDVEITNSSEHLPRFNATGFLVNLSREISGLTKAHYYLTRLKTMPMVLLRVYLHDSPYATESSLAVSSASLANDGSKSVFFIFPDGSPYVYVSLATYLGQTVGEEGRNLRDILLHAIPKAFSRPSARYELQNTNLTTRQLSSLLTFRGPGRSIAAAGGWSIFAEHSFSQNALDFAIASRGQAQSQENKVKGSSNSDKENEIVASKSAPGRPKRALADSKVPDAKRTKEIAEGRFGISGKDGDNMALERFEVRIDDPFPSLPSAVQQVQAAKPVKRTRKGRQSDLDRSLEEMTASDPNHEGRDGPWTPDVRIAFHGSHVFAGIRELIEQGVVDGEKMPGWMSGEAGVSVGAIKEGRIRTKGDVPGV